MRDYKSRLAEVIDLTLLWIVSAAIFFLALRTATNNIFSVGGAIGGAFCAAGLARRGSAARRNNFFENRNFDTSIAALADMGENGRADYFEKVFGDYAKVERNGARLSVNGKRFYSLFLPESALICELCRIREECIAYGAKAVVACDYPIPSAAERLMLDSNGVTSLKEKTLKDIFADFPLPIKTKAKAENRLLGIAKIAFTRKLFRRYLFTAFFLIGSAYILPTSPLFLAIGALNVVFALLCLSPLFKSKPE